MDAERKVKMLQAVYAGALADSVLRMGNAGILEDVTREKRQEQMQTGRLRAAQFGAEKPEQVFEKLVELFACANWKTEKTDDGFEAVSTGCMLCALAKRMNAQSPCSIYCLDVMEGMVKGLDPQAEYEVKQTLWDTDRCKVTVKTKL